MSHITSSTSDSTLILLIYILYFTPHPTTLSIYSLVQLIIFSSFHPSLYHIAHTHTNVHTHTHIHTYTHTHTYAHMHTHTHTHTHMHTHRVQYSLTAVVRHLGSSAQAGHYTAMCKDNKGSVIMIKPFTMILLILLLLLFHQIWSKSEY